MANGNATSMPAVPVTPVTPQASVAPVLKSDETTIIVKDEVLNMITKAFDIQDDYENESKFVRAFIFSATNSFLKAQCSRAIAQWDSLVARASKLHPQMTREQVEADLLQRKAARSIHTHAVKALELKKDLN